MSNPTRIQSKFSLGLVEPSENPGKSHCSLSLSISSCRCHGSWASWKSSVSSAPWNWKVAISVPISGSSCRTLSPCHSNQHEKMAQHYNQQQNGNREQWKSGQQNSEQQNNNSEQWKSGQQNNEQQNNNSEQWKNGQQNNEQQNSNSEQWKKWTAEH